MSGGKPVDTIVVGLDGACFELLDQWVEAGKLPTIERLIDTGVRGPLESVLPPVTSPAWKAYATGKNPGKLGVFWWFNIDTEARESYVPVDRYGSQTEFWEILAAAGPVGVIGVPTTYPPKQLDGFMVSGAPDGQNSGFTHPPDLAEELREKFDYRVTSRHHRQERSDSAEEERLELIDQQFRAAEYLLSTYDVSFLQVTTFYLNALHHSVWDDAVTLEAWQRIDDHIESLLDIGKNVVLMSDHGMAEIRTVFRINQWLKERGLLATDGRLSELFYKLGIRSDPLKVLLSRVDSQVPGADLDRIVERLLPQWFLDNVPNEDGELSVGTHAQLDWEHTDVVASGLGPVYLTAESGTERYRTLRQSLIEALETLTDPAGRPVARAVYRSEDVYTGPYVAEGPDLLIEPTDGTYIAQGYGQTEVFSEEYHRWQAVNTTHGFFVANGPAFGTGTVTDVSLLDLAPTILHLHGHRVPADMDGTVRKALFGSETEPKRRDVRYERPAQ